MLLRAFVLNSLLFSSLALAAGARAQDAIANLRLEHLTLQDGLSHGGIVDLIQDRQGYLWIATDGGLNRYDGYDFEVYRSVPFDTTSLASDYALVVYEDADGSVLVGTYYAELCRLDRARGAFTCHTLPAYGEDTRALRTIEGIARAGDGTLWVGGSDGLYREEAPGRFTRFTHDPADPTSLSHRYVTGLHVAVDGALWVSTLNGLSRLDEVVRDADGRPQARFSRWLSTSPAAPTVAERLFKITVDPFRAGRWWVGSGRGVVAFDPRTGAAERFVPHPDGGSNLVMRVAPDPADPDVLWVPVMDRGLSRLDSRTGTFAHVPERPGADDGPLPMTGSTALTDRFGIVWVGSYGAGLSRFDPAMRAVHHLGRATPTQAGLPNASISGLHVTRDRALWAGTTERYLLRIERADDGSLARVRSWQASPPGAPRTPSQPAGEPYDFAEAPDGALWIGTTRGLSRLDRSTGRFTHLVHDRDDPASLASGIIMALLFDRDEPAHLWVAGEGGLSLLDTRDGTILRQYRADPLDPQALPNGWITTLLRAADGGLWVGHDLGLSRLDVEGETFTHILHDPDEPTGLTSGTISALLERPSKPGIFWVGTLGGGLDRLDTRDHTATHFTTANSDLPDHYVYSLLSDADGRLWMSTNRGLARVDADTRAIRPFGVGSGVQDLEFNQHAAHADTATGQLLFGGINGITWFGPDALAPSTEPPALVLTEIRAAGRPLRFDAPEFEIEEAGTADEVTALTLPYSARTVGVTFAGLHFKYPARNRYRYRLLGLEGEQDWSEPTATRTVTYTNLSAGTYTFEVQASNSDGVWGAEPRQLRLTVRPPWWRSAWAYAVYALLLGLGVFAVDRVQRRRLFARARERERARERAHAREIEQAYTQLKATQAQLIQQEKLASLGQLTAGIAHEIKNPLNFVTNFADVSRELTGELREALADGTDPVNILDDLEQTATVIGEHGRRADAIVKAMMQHARASSGERETVDLNALVAEHVALAHHGRRAQTPGFDVTLVEDYDAAVGSVTVQPQELGRVVVNLVTNAFDAVAGDAATPSGGTRTRDVPRVTVTTERTGDTVEIRVTDNGPGVPAALRTKVFEPFFTTKPTGQGTGLGLSLSYDIVTQGHGGTLAVESDEGQGAAFLVTLPVSQAEHAPRT